MNTAEKWAASHFKTIKDENEKIIWVSRPKFSPFLLKSIPVIVFGLIWAIASNMFFFQKIYGSSYVHLVWFIYMGPTWLSIVHPLKQTLVYQNIFYACTNKRILIRGGFWGISYESIDLRNIIDIQVNIDFIESKFNVGTLTI